MIMTKIHLYWLEETLPALACGKEAQMRTMIACAVVFATLVGGSASLAADKSIPITQRSAIGFVMTSSDASVPCPIFPELGVDIYTNASPNAADVSVQLVNTGASNLVLFHQGVISGAGPGQVRTTRFALPASQSLRINSEGATCSWIAVIVPH